MLTNVTMNERMSRCIPIAWITPKRSGTSKEKCITSSVSVSALWKLIIPKKVIMLLAYSIRRKQMIKGVRYWMYVLFCVNMKHICSKLTTKYNTVLNRFDWGVDDTEFTRA